MVTCCDGNKTSWVYLCNVCFRSASLNFERSLSVLICCKRSFFCCAILCWFNCGKSGTSIKYNEASCKSPKNLAFNTHSNTSMWASGNVSLNKAKEGDEAVAGSGIDREAAEEGRWWASALAATGIFKLSGITVRCLSCSW